MKRATTPPRVLIVEDDPDIAACLSERLRCDGYVVDVARNGREALARLQAAPYHVVFLDMILDGIPGLAVLHEMRARQHVMPVIAMSGHHYLLHAALRQGASAGVHKPFDFPALGQILHRCLHQPAQMT
jgi:DNA-binding NtrC family response regulator